MDCGVKFEFKLEQYNSLMQNYAQQPRCFFSINVFYKAFIWAFYIGYTMNLCTYSGPGMYMSPAFIQII